MPHFDISRLRKENGMSQNELARHLQMTQSFLSAIENGKSPLPIEKEDKLCEIFGLKNLSEYVVDKKNESEERRINDMTDSDLFNQLLSRFHRQAHSSEGDHHHHDHHEQIEALEEKVETLFRRNDSLMERNDRLATDNDRLRRENDDLRNQIESLRKEAYLLKSELLAKGKDK